MRVIPAVMVIVGGAIVFLPELFRLFNPIDPENVDYLRGYSLLFGIALTVIGGLWATFVEKSLPGALEDARLANDNARELEVASRLQQSTHEFEVENFLDHIDELDWYADFKSELYELQNVAYEYIENYFVRDREVGEKDIKLLLDNTSRALSKLMDFQPGDYWTISIYRLENTQPQSLRSIANQTSQRSEETKSHRTWKVGEGVAGEVLKKGMEVILADATDPKEARWLHIPYKSDDESKKSTDFLRYKSLAGVPIKVGDQIWGVAVASSDTPKHFNVDDQGFGGEEIEPLRLLARVVALSQAPTSRNGFETNTETPEDSTSL